MCMGLCAEVTGPVGKSPRLKHGMDNWNRYPSKVLYFLQLPSATTLVSRNLPALFPGGTIRSVGITTYLVTVTVLKTQGKNSTWAYGNSSSWAYDWIKSTATHYVVLKPQTLNHSYSIGFSR